MWPSILPSIQWCRLIDWFSLLRSRGKRVTCRMILDFLSNLDREIARFAWGGEEGVLFACKRVWPEIACPDVPSGCG